MKKRERKRGEKEKCKRDEHMKGERKDARLKQVQDVTAGRKQEEKTMKRGDRTREDEEGKRRPVEGREE